RAIEAMDHAAMTALVHPDVQLVEHPNKLNPKGTHTDRAAMDAAWDRGAALMARQTYEVRGLTVEGGRCVAQIGWTGELKTGAVMRAQICSVIELRDGKVWRQEQYDCFEA